VLPLPSVTRQAERYVAAYLERDFGSGLGKTAACRWNDKGLGLLQLLLSSPCGNWGRLKHRPYHRILAVFAHFYCQYESKNRLGLPRSRGWCVIDGYETTAAIIIGDGI
jgi:hypothetical protein